MFICPVELDSENHIDNVIDSLCYFITHDDFFLLNLI